MFLYNKIRSNRWLRNPMLPGIKVPIGNREIHLRSEGIISEFCPKIILDIGTGLPSATLWPLQKELAKITQTITYDRAGYGWSTYDSEPRTSARAIEDLYCALKNAHVSGPFILIGHSLGGLYMYHFACKYPELVKGVILLDAVPLDNFRFKHELSAAAYDMAINKASGITLFRFLAKMGIPRLINLFKQYSFPIDLDKQLREYFCQDSLFKTWLSEMNNLELSITQVKDAAPFPSIPLWVVTHSRQIHIEYYEKMGKGYISKEDAENIENLWEETYRKYLNSSPLSQWIVATNSSHAIPLDQPDFVIQLTKTLLTHTSKNLISIPQYKQ